jgi:hypothetical protein
LRGRAEKTSAQTGRYKARLWHAAAKHAPGRVSSMSRRFNLRTAGAMTAEG